jgi:hypothetical protein
MADIVEEIEHDVEVAVDAFLPKSGGLVDRHRKEKARREAAQKDREQIDERIEESGYRSVKIVQLSPEIFATNVVNIPAAGSSMILPNSPYRYRATIAVITTGQTIIISKDSGAALSGIGFPLIQGNNPLPVYGRGQLYASCANACQVAVIAEIYAPENGPM